MKKYSIILPVRNGGNYIKQCVDSILNQSLQDFNLIILDNYSTDGTTEWLEGLHDERIVLYPSMSSLTIEENWGRVITIPKNEFMTMIGHDDILGNDYLTVMDDLIKKYPGASLYQAHFQLIDSKGNRIRSCKAMAETEDAPAFLKTLLTNNFDLFGTGFMMRSKDYDTAGGIPPYPNLLFSDFELWMQITRNSYKATSQMECFSYRLHQSMTKTSSDFKLHKAFSQFVHYLNKLKQEDKNLKRVIEEYGPAFLSLYCKGLSHRLLRTPLSKREGLTVKSFLNECKEYSEFLFPLSKFDALYDRTVRLAELIDSNALSRRLFLIFKKIYSKPVLK